jgi:hypothetical protein
VSDVPGRTLVAVMTVTALCCVVAGCGSSATSGSAAPQSAAGAKPSAAKRIDACSMIAPQDISSLLGAPATGVSTGKDPTQGDCMWTNSATDESISLTISNPSTALNNKLPPAEAGFPDPTTPGPDGMRYTGGGGVEFAAGNRVNTVQVAVLRMSSDEANAAAVKLAHEVAPQVPQ